MSKVNITLSAYYNDSLYHADSDGTLFAAQLTDVDLTEIATLQSKVAELSSLIPSFQELVVTFTGRADFIKSVVDEGTEWRFLNESGSDLTLKFHANPISNDLFDVELVRNVNLHVRKDGFYVMGFEKHNNTTMETEMIYFDKLPTV